MDAMSPEGANFFERVEQELQALSSELTLPRPRECLVCYVYRMLEFACHGHHWMRRYRDLRAPRATALEERMERRGGYCDCEMLQNAFTPNPYIFERNDEGEYFMEPMPACGGVRAGSTQPCTLWFPHQTPRWYDGYSPYF